MPPRGSPNTAATTVALKLTPSDSPIMSRRSSLLRAAHRSNEKRSHQLRPDAVAKNGRPGNRPLRATGLISGFHPEATVPRTPPRVPAPLAPLRRYEPLRVTARFAWNKGTPKEAAEQTSTGHVSYTKFTAFGFVILCD